jgi:hypothetical protein
MFIILKNKILKMELSKMIKDDNKSLAASILNASKNINGANRNKINLKDNRVEDN